MNNIRGHAAFREVHALFPAKNSSTCSTSLRSDIKILQAPAVPMIKTSRRWQQVEANKKDKEENRLVQATTDERLNCYQRWGRLALSNPRRLKN